MMMNILKLIGREYPLFRDDISKKNDELADLVSSNKFLVIGGAGSIGQAVIREIFKRNPQVLHVVDISENSLVELVRDIRSSIGYIKGDFRTFAIDCGSPEFQALMASNLSYDYIINLSAMKHVRSERDPFTIMRLIKVNILNTIQISKLVQKSNAKKYFCVSTDKAANPVNIMGASKRIMEMFLMRESESINISMARFANVAFSDGSLLHGFKQRFYKQQPISAPNDIYRYFVTSQESGELCLMSCLFGDNRDIYFPKLSEKLHMTTFSIIAERYLESMGFETFNCETEDEARVKSAHLINQKKWPCYFFPSDTTGEKSFEEFFTDNEELDLDTFTDIGIIKNKLEYDNEQLNEFLKGIKSIERGNIWSKEAIVEQFNVIMSDFNHKETGKYLDDRM